MRRNRRDVGSRYARWAFPAAVVFVLAAPAPPADARQLTVGPEGEYTTIRDAVADAGPGDTVVVASGLYPERLQLRTSLVLIGRGWPVIDGGGRGHVLEAFAPIELRGFVIRGSGSTVDTEDAGLMARDARVRVEGNRFEDVFYGVYVKNGPGSLVRGNRIVGKPFAPARRGDGIRLWYSSGSVIESNDVVGTRDVVVYFSDSLVVRDNLIVDGRYGLHYMYSDHNRFERNRFLGNRVGAFIMYSTDIELRDNVFAETARYGGMGLGLKDADEILAAGNVFVRNGAGIYLDNSPHSRGVTNRFTGNLIFANSVGARLLPSVHSNVFSENDFLDNHRPVEIRGGGGGRGFRNDWRGNAWSEYAGFDEDGDGTGDTPFVYARLADELLSRHPDLQIFWLSPAVEALEVLSRFFPLLRPQPIVVDSAPRLGFGQRQRWEAAPPISAPPGDAPVRPATAAALWAGLGLLAAGGVWGAARRARAPRAGSRGASG
ncbi:MAG: nitrous oxide reductase family maturation protein NosD [Gemmatimonadota bacterium]